MNDAGQNGFATEEAVRLELQRRPHLLLRLAENALTVADSLRENYFRNTAAFIAALRKAGRLATLGKREDAILRVQVAPDLAWEDLKGEVVTFIDGGVGQVQVASQVPILLRVGSYAVRTGERDLAERESFGYYPVILGNLEGGSKERKDFIDIVRITSELLGGLSALSRMPDLRVLMFHGPLVYLVGNYSGHAPFTERDIDVFLGNYAADSKQGQTLKTEFLAEAAAVTYRRMVEGRADEMVQKRLFDPLAWMAFLYRKLIAEAKQRNPKPILCGVVERSGMREFSERVLLQRVFDGLARKGKQDHFNNLYGRTDLKTSKSLLDKLGYTDTLLLAMLLRPGEYSEPWPIDKYSGLRGGSAQLYGEAFETPMNWSVLQPPGAVSFPAVEACYLCVSETTEPVRIEVFPELGPDQLVQAVGRAYLYAKLLPGYGFPVGLDVADKYAKVPAWLTEAYAKLIRHHLSVSLQQGEITDAEMRRILVQAIYMTHRDWLFRPGA
jgi:hypothetical protein